MINDLPIDCFWDYNATAEGEIPEQRPVDRDFLEADEATANFNVAVTELWLKLVVGKVAAQKCNLTQLALNISNYLQCFTNLRYLTLIWDSGVHWQLGLPRNFVRSFERSLYKITFPCLESLTTR